MRILGIDPGSRRIGLALSDEDGIIASALPTHLRMRTETQDLAALQALMAARGVEAVVVGWPVNLDGSRGDMARQAERLAARLEEKTGLPVELYDERLTSCEAERVLLEGDVSRRDRKRLRDGLAAVLILQGYLDRRSAASSSRRAFDGGP